MKIYNASPNSIIPIDFNIVYLPRQEFLVTELLLSYGGISLVKIVPVSKSEILLEILDQLLHSVNYLECYNIEHNDIKLENILLDQSLDQYIIRLIDFDLARNQSKSLHKSKSRSYHGFTEIYEAPEIYRIFKQNLQKINKYDVWKAQIYSVGITILQLLGYLI